VQGADGISPIAKEARKEAGDSVTVISEDHGVIDQESAYKIGPGHVGRASPRVPLRDLPSFLARPALAVRDSPQFSPLPGATTALVVHGPYQDLGRKARVSLASHSGRPTAPRSY
jgi:hypothetical protein